VPRADGVPWDDRIPYPVFAIGAHILLQDCSRADGPTALVPGSHRSGRLAPFDRMMDADLSYDGRPPVLLEGAAGDVAMFVSDAWHRGLPAHGGRGRYFLQVHYGRRDLAQRIRTTAEVSQLSPEAIARADTDRARSLVGLHDPFFYDG
jgi:ectoine hydroxylase-related dioxygenase (phytanoyl-CoA dioxygenase family)